MTLDPQVLQFLRELSENNYRQWFEANRKNYQTAKKHVEAFVVELLAQLSELDPQVGELRPKDCLFRIHRDVRFSKNKNPYKTNFGASIKPGGRKSKWAGYYLHIAPDGESFLGGGTYMPPSEHLAKIRQEIDYCGDELRQLLAEPAFRQTFGELQGEQLKTAPKGYPKDHEHIDLLRYKSLVVFRNLSDADLLALEPEAMKKDFAVMQPFLDFLNRGLEEVEQ